MRLKCKLCPEKRCWTITAACFSIGLSQEICIGRDNISCLKKGYPKGKIIIRIVIWVKVMTWDNMIDICLLRSNILINRTKRNEITLQLNEITLLDFLRLLGYYTKDNMLFSIYDSGTVCNCALKESCAMSSKFWGLQKICASSFSQSWLDSWTNT